MKKRFANRMEAMNYLSFRGFKIYAGQVLAPKDRVVGIKTWGVLDYLGFSLRRGG